MTQESIHIGHPPRAPRRKRWPLVATLTVVVLGAVVLATVLIAPRFGGFKVTGTMMLNSNSWTVSTGQTCLGKGGYADLKPGAQVVVTNAAGSTIAIGELEPGRPSGSGCLFPFSVGSVPSGHDFYGIEVSHRGRLQYDAERIRRPLILTIGS